MAGRGPLLLLLLLGVGVGAWCCAGLWLGRVGVAGWGRAASTLRREAIRLTHVEQKRC